MSPINVLFQAIVQLDVIIFFICIPLLSLHETCQGKDAINNLYAIENALILFNNLICYLLRKNRST